MNNINYIGAPFGSMEARDYDRTSYAKKRANDWKWLDEKAEYYINSYSGLDLEEEERMRLNYRLFNGRGKESRATNTAMNSIMLQDEGLYFNDEDIPHHDIIIPIVKSIIGQQQLTPLEPMAIDSSLFNLNSKKKRKLELIKKYLDDTLLSPIKEQAYREWMQENKVNDPATLNPDQQQEMQNQIGERVKAMTPEDVERFMSSEYKSPSEIQLQQILNYIIKRDKIKFWTDENFKNLNITGKEVYDTFIKNDRSYFRILNPLNFSYGGGETAFFIEDCDWGVYEETLTIPELFNMHGQDLSTPSKMKKLENIILNNNRPYGRRRGEFPEPMNTRIAQYDAQTKFFDYAPDMRTPEGQEFQKLLHLKFGHVKNFSEGVTRYKVAFKALRELQLVDRYNKEENKYTQFWVDEHYERNPKKDIRIRKGYFPQTFINHRIGDASGDNGLYVAKGPMLNQYTHMNNPYDCKLPFIGVEYSKVFGNTDNVAPMDLAKPWQDKFNVKLAKLTEKEATDIGKIMTIATGMKPQDWSYGKWLMMAKYGKILPLDTSNEDFNGIDANIVKALDLSEIIDYAGHLQQLQWYRDQAALAMGYNPSRLGQIVPTTAVANNQQNIQQSSYQTQDIFSLHNQVVENLLNIHIINERAALKDNDYIASYILDDMSRAELKINKEVLDQSIIGVFIRNSSEDFNTLQRIKGNSQNLLQNGMISFTEYVRLENSKSLADVVNLSEYSEKKMAKRSEEQHKAEQDLIKAQEAMKMEIMKLQQQFIATENQMDRDSKERTALIDSFKFANQQDADRDGLTDQLEREAMVEQHETEENVKSRKHEKELLELKLNNDKEIARIKERSSVKTK